MSKLTVTKTGSPVRAGGLKRDEGLAQVYHRLDDKEIDPAVGQRPGLLGECTGQRRLVGVADGLEELSGRPDLPGDEPAGGRRLCASRRRPPVDFDDLIGQPIVREL